MARAEATPNPTGSLNSSSTPSVPAASIRSCPEASKIIAQTISLLSAGLSTNALSRETLNSEVATRIRKELSPLVSEKRMEDSQAVSEAIARATTSSIESKTRTLSVEGPSGSKVLAVYKKQGEVVHRGEKIATILHNGHEVPIVATADGIMQEINISKGGHSGESSSLLGPASQIPLGADCHDHHLPRHPLIRPCIPSYPYHVQSSCVG